MTVISSKEFATHQKKYFDLAISEDIRIKRGKNMFQLLCDQAEEPKVHKRVYYEPDEDFYNSITIEELREKTHEYIDKFFADK